MSRDKMMLPSLYEPSPSVRVHSINDYRIWEDGKKKAYRAELDKQVKERRRSREKSLQEKSAQRFNLSALVQQQKAKLANDKYAKIKTEQKYMEDNYKLMKKDRIGQRLKQLWGESREHPFVTLLDQEQKRKKQTKSNFMFQNKINDVQNQVKRSIKKKRRQESVAEGKNYVNYVQAQFQKQMRQRMNFQQKYLKVDKDSIQSYKQQHLNALKDQSDARYSQISKKQQTSRHKNKSMIGGEQLLSHKRTHKMSQDAKLKSGRFIDEDLSLKKHSNNEMKIVRNVNSYKVQTQRAAEELDTRLVTDRNRAQSSFINSSSNVIKYKQVHPVRQYKHYDIIKNSQKIFIN